MHAEDAQSWTLIISAVGAALVAVATAVTTLFVTLRGNARATVVATVQDDKVQKVIEKVEEVHTLTNTNFTEQKQKIAALEARIQSMMESKVEAESVRSVLASEAAAQLTASTPPKEPTR